MYRYNKGHEIVDVSVMEDGRTMAKVKVTDIVEKESYWIFIMVGLGFTAVGFSLTGINLKARQPLVR